ncbi:MAG: MerR family transcriptional regulator [Micromonosporaceae bacterium]|nr:MerR family transcriptional regulator [Micromonosporaceae bacterium]
MRIGEAARAAGVSPRALRFYEDEGLIRPGRCANGYRDYCRFTVDRVVVIRSLLDSGLPIPLIREVMPDVTVAASPGTVVPPPELRRRIEAYRDRLDARIAALIARRAALDDLLSRGFDDDGAAGA